MRFQGKFMQGNVKENRASKDKQPKQKPGWWVRWEGEQIHDQNPNQTKQTKTLNRSYKDKITKINLLKINQES